MYNQLESFSKNLAVGVATSRIETPLRACMEVAEHPPPSSLASTLQEHSVHKMDFPCTILTNASLALMYIGWLSQLSLEETGEAAGERSDAFEGGSAARILDADTTMHASARSQGREGGTSLRGVWRIESWSIPQDSRRHRLNGECRLMECLLDPRVAVLWRKMPCTVVVASGSGGGSDES